ncbi:Putative Zn(II)2Cys6 transcription factor [Beauveria bassiana ARSEF 2860]|uniref:Putative Zn(II)2Cys6 transcription factor n=1 Tax=Beauveria bassiana (strain ARSEF 2860) TaxID=655819 RepID=J4UKE2_BEAB2|nr:Putative Zn(II)2Cys6 transcription factor [Beauveria bassiana ARSEF 2860]EJP64647.1 Putative Zn(II)2Cys6 transcription factor [Beauveria bassiana ARSEF 2860]
MDSVQSTGHQPRRTRQNPVSCRLCRLKKLKCNRQHPCSNCSTRGVACEYIARIPGPTSTGGTDQRQALPAAAEGAGFQARLERLEEAVFSRHDDTPSVSSATAPSIRRSLATTAIPGFAFNEEHEVTSRWLEGIGTLENPIFRTHVANVPFKAGPISQLLKNVSASRNEAAPACPPRVQLPTREEAIHLSQYFIDNVQYLHPVFQPHSLQRVIDAVYMHPDTPIQSNVADIALLLSILASASHLWRPQRSKCLVFLSAKEAAAMSLIWTNAAMDILEYSKRTIAASVEGLQATIVISYVIYNSQGFSPMFRSLHSTIIMIARDLSLHRTDSPRRSGEKDQPPSQIEADVKRRLWWHIAATDWLLAFTPGPQEGTYTIQLSQMHVNQPDYLESCDNDAGNVSPSTSYFIQRVRLAEICRAVVDSLPPLEMIENANYEQVVLLDGKFEDLITSLPAFFRLDQGSELLYTAPQLTLQCCLIHLGIHTRRSRLHQPFVVAGFADTKYTFSRNACLNSSRAVLQICYKLEEKKDDLELIPARFATVVHHVFMAAVVLVMDLCSNKVEGLEEQRQAEVTRACRMLDSLKQDSAMAAKLAHPLMEILQKHKQRLQQSQSSAMPLPVVLPHADNRTNQVSLDPSNDFHGPLSNHIGQYASSTTASGADHQPAVQTEHQQQPCANDREFDAMMQQYIDLSQFIDGPSWGSLFDDLDSHHMTDAAGATFSG